MTSTGIIERGVEIEAGVLSQTTSLKASQDVTSELTENAGTAHSASVFPQTAEFDAPVGLETKSIAIQLNEQKNVVIKSAQKSAKEKQRRIQFAEDDLVIEDILDQAAEATKGNRFRSKWLAIVTIKGRPIEERWFCKGLLKSDLKRLLAAGKINEGLKSKLEMLIARSDQIIGKESESEEGESIAERIAEQEVYATNKVKRYLPKLQPEARYVKVVSREGKKGKALVLSREVVGFRPFTSITKKETALLSILKKGELPFFGELMIYSQGVNEIDLNFRGIGFVEQKDGTYEASRIDFGNCMGKSPEDFEDTQNTCMDFTKTSASVIAMPWLSQDKEQGVKTPKDPGYKKDYRVFVWLDTHRHGKSTEKSIFDLEACRKSQNLWQGKYLAILNLILTPDKFLDADGEAYKYGPDYEDASGIDVGLVSIDKANKMQYRTMAKDIPGFKEFFLQQFELYQQNKGAIATLYNLLQQDLQSYEMDESALESFNTDTANIASELQMAPSLLMIEEVASVSLVTESKDQEVGSSPSALSMVADKKVADEKKPPKTSWLVRCCWWCPCVSSSPSSPRPNQAGKTLLPTYTAS